MGPGQDAVSALHAPGARQAWTASPGQGQVCWAPPDKTGVGGWGAVCLPSPLPLLSQPLFLRLPAGWGEAAALPAEGRSPDEEAVGGQAPFRPEAARRAGKAWGGLAGGLAGTATTAGLLGV